MWGLGLGGGLRTRITLFASMRPILVRTYWDHRRSRRPKEEQEEEEEEEKGR